MRYRRVRISHQLLMGMLVTGNHINVQVVSGLPSDAQFRYITSGSIFGIDVVVESDDFDELKDGDEIPIHPEIQIARAL
jgi:hypothetical protein